MFNDDLLIGYKAELYAMYYIQKTTNKKVLPINNLVDDKKEWYAFDFCTINYQNNHLSIDETYEVKYDIASGKTNNLCFEFAQNKNKQASGISKTKADNWVHFATNPNRFFVEPTSKIRSKLPLLIIDSSQSYSKEGYISFKNGVMLLNNGGDNSVAMYIVPIKLLDGLVDWIEYDFEEEDFVRFSNYYQKSELCNSASV